MRETARGAPTPPFPEQEQERPGVEKLMDPKPDHGEESYRGSGRLQDKVALITGGDSGIGRAVALAFAREGAHVAFSHVPEAEEEDAEETRRLVEGATREAMPVAADLADPKACRDLVESAAGHFGRIDILVNNASFQGKSFKVFEEIDEERIAYTFAVNIQAMFHVTRHALPHMGEGGAIINTTSIQAYDPSPGILDYACTKAAIVNFTRGLSTELVERGIRVNAVAPGPVWTPLIPQSFPPEVVANFGGDNPMGRPAQPADLAPSYVFLASNESRFTSGEILAVTGGRRTC